MSVQQTSDPWVTAWLDAVDEKSMTQRKLTAIEQHGGLDTIKAAASARGVHLVQLTDDKGDLLIAASRHPFKVLC